ncbi:guanine deaminase [Salmonella enterica subsp. houtenae]|nr:guanine deaminase [Salmonella enterica subsp. houtenae]EDR0192435.1 guanine deaminase [Salmonella enterica subsp. houtenae]
MENLSFVLKGCGFSAHSDKNITYIKQSLFCINKAGYIARIIPTDEPDYVVFLNEARKANILRELKQGEYLLPGFIDLHIHAPQWPNLSKALDRPLEEWLQEYTFPLESRYSDMEYARENYQHLVKTLLANGTTTAVYFATIHREASVELGRICLQQGQRALVGKVAMDDKNACPENYRDASAFSAIEETRRFIDDIKQLPGNDNALILPVITPRFIPCCTTELLEGLGKLAQETGCHIQTHCSESDWEHNFVLKKYSQTDTQALKRFGLLSRKTVLAHSNHITDEDMDIIKGVDAGIAHCPISNFYFANSVFPLRKAIDKQLNVGLGSDISAGFSPSLFDACRHAVVASKALNDGVDARISAEQRGCQSASISFAEAFWLATAGGGIVLDLPIGKLDTGYLFDAMIVDTNSATSNIFIYEDQDTPHDILQKIIYNTQRSDISVVWVGGKQVR